MPYRRLPKTDVTRIKSLEAIVDKDDARFEGTLVVSYKAVDDARLLLARLRRAHQYYMQQYQTQAREGKRCRHHAYMARLYVSHFIQVLDMATIRKEIKPEAKRLYGLEPMSHVVPDLSTDAALVRWGEAVIRGERERLRSGGSPIYNPAIAKVSVYYTQFVDALHEQQQFRLNTSRAHEQVAAMRDEVDALLLDVWNQVEAAFAGLPLAERVARCREFGLIYYYRSGELSGEE
jgi:hypothetical protein